MSQVDYGMYVEGIGDRFGLFRWVTDSRGIQDRETVPVGAIGRITQELDFESGRTNIGSGQISLMNTDEVLSFFRNHNPVPVAQIEDVTGSSFDFGSSFTGHENKIVYWRREAILLGTETSPGVYDVQRARLLTREEDPDKGSNFNVYFTPPSIKGRKCTIFTRNRVATEKIAGQMVIRNVSSSQNPTQSQVTFAGPLDLVRKAELTPRVVTATPRFVSTDATTGEITRIYCSVDPDEFGDNPRPVQLSSSVGEGGTILISYLGAIFEARWRATTIRSRSEIDFDPRQNYYGLTDGIDRSSLADGKWSQHSVGEVVCIGRNFRNTLGSNLVDVVMTLLTSTPEGTNGPWDNSMGLGAGMPINLFDVAGIEAFRELKGEAFELGRWFFKIAEESPNILSFIEQNIFRPFMVAFGYTTGEFGDQLLTLEADGDVSVLDQRITFDEENFIGPLDQSDRIQETIGFVKYKFSPQELALGESRRIQLLDQFQKEENLDATNKTEVDATIIDNRFQAHNQALSRLLRTRDAIPLVNFVIDYEDQQVDIGTLHGLTSTSLVFNGLQGFVDVDMRMVSKEINLSNFTVQYKAKVVGAVFPRRKVISWAALIEGYSEPLITIKQNEFSLVDADGIENDFVCQTINAVTGEPRVSNIIVEKVNNTTLRVLNPPKNIVVGSVLISESYGNTIPAQQDRDAFFDVEATYGT